MPDEIQNPQAQDATPPQVTEPQVTTPETPATEEPFDKDRAMATINKLRETEKQYKKDQKELERLKADEKKRTEAQMSETERLTKQAKELADKNAKLEGDILRRDVIAETGLPVTFADRLKGTTRDELLADAQELSKTLPQLKAAPKIAPTNPGNAQTADKTQETRSWLNGSHGNPFESSSVEQKGGGVFGK